MTLIKGLFLATGAVAVVLCIAGAYGSYRAGVWPVSGLFVFMAMVSVTFIAVVWEAKE